MAILFERQKNLNSLDRLLRGIFGGLMFLHAIQQPSSRRGDTCRRGEKMIGSLLLGTSVLGFDPLLSFWGTTTVTGAPNHLFHLLQ